MEASSNFDQSTISAGIFMLVKQQGGWMETDIQGNWFPR